MVAFLGRITKTHTQIAFYQGVNGFVGIVGLVSLLLVTVDCPIAEEYYWSIFENQAASCPTQVRSFLDQPC